MGSGKIMKGHPSPRYMPEIGSVICHSEAFTQCYPAEAARRLEEEKKQAQAIRCMGRRGGTNRMLAMLLTDLWTAATRLMT
eukprot:scaffold17060_cov80-Skeletonema_marinoi.AAC.2